MQDGRMIFQLFVETLTEMISDPVAS